MSDLTKKLEGKEQEEYIREHFKSKEEKSEQIEEEIEEEEEETEEEEDLRELKEKLEDIADGRDIKAEVAQEILDSIDEDYSIEGWFEDLFQGGCASGFIGSLIYYNDTNAFFDKHYDEIDELRNDYEESIGEPLKIEGDLKNGLAWFSFEEVARQLANELDINI